ncbi:hypothetical protein TW85_04980 [Marinomonas sp. S3726]|uniref:hypothetical protein n=1 Tax=Marinomonas sp. S3726 TaxID=579484 RepID=UPI0005F9DCAB|nr:hypothetical protein [Marinomonas sp. S3726]KJZ15396.1 hypothetical protein TW85_04980 [Marinomonas sp. S3726]
MLNRYELRLKELIEKYRSYNLNQFSGPNNQVADFDDLVWFYIDPNSGRKVKFLATIPNSGRTLNRLNALSYPYNYLFKVFVIQLSNKQISAKSKQREALGARKLLSVIKCSLYQLNQELYYSIKGRNDHKAFVDFLFENQLTPRFTTHFSENRDRTGGNVVDQRFDKLPKDASIITIGAIFNEVFKDVNLDGTIKEGSIVDPLSALVTTTSLLALSSPNRLNAETFLIPKQKLKSYKEGNQPPIYYLDWIGSKGYKNNKNHLLSALSKQVEKAVNFFNFASEPSRILCRFYQNPNQSLKLLLSGFEVCSDRKNRFKLGQNIHLFQLGYILGFYNEDIRISVLKRSMIKPTLKQYGNSKYWESKPVYLLEKDDLIRTSMGRRGSIGKLFDHSLNRGEFHNLFKNNYYISISELEAIWIYYLTKVALPSFPLFFLDDKSVRLESSLFCCNGSFFAARVLGKSPTGKDSGRLSGPYNLGKSMYAILPPSYLSSITLRKLSPQKSKATKTIFEDYNFSRELGLKPHSLRHYANTLAFKSNIPIEIISAWSGRVSNEQTYTYIHVPETDKTNRVRAIINPTQESIDSVDIKIITMKDISVTTHFPATITSTGVCTQELNVTPCDYLNDFSSQCFMCSQSCHIAGDTDAINFLNKDKEFQIERLKSIKGDPRLSSSKAMQEWYIIHSRNTEILFKLVELMLQKAKGTIIRFRGTDTSFILTDLTSRQVEEVRVELPNFKVELSDFLSKSPSTKDKIDNLELTNLLSSFGVNKGEI